MGWDATYRELVAKLRGKNGSYDEKTPKLKASDMVAFLGLYTTNIGYAVGRASEAIVRSDYATSEGLFDPSPRNILSNITAGGPQPVEAALYVSSYVGLPKAAWKRTPTQLTDHQRLLAETLGISAITWEPVRYQTLIASEQLEQIDFVRQLMADRERALDAGASALSLYFLGYASKDLCSSFLAAMRAVGSDLDVLSENPPVSLRDELAGALDAARQKSEDALVSIGNAAGKAAAEIGNVAGQVAGSAAEGFFSRATMLTIAVAGIAAYVALR